jgi:outer membrane immunogenic protein
MRNVIKTLAIAATVAGAATFAHAADAIDSVPAAPEATEIAPANSGWEGAYVGGKMTYQWGKVQSGKGYQANGLGGGLYGGYNMQNGQLVYGGETDLNYSGVNATSNGVKTRQGVNGSLRARVGYDVGPALIYSTAGVAATNLKASDATSSANKTLYGLTAGVGVETKLTDTITARTEYRFTDYQNQTFGLNSGATDRSLKEHSVNVGLGVRF